MSASRPSSRPSWDSYFLTLAETAATRSTCPRKSVGCVLVRDRSILATGYNGSIAGAPHCSDVGCRLEGGHCVMTVHAEANALVQAARHGARVEGATAYVNVKPCFGCLKLLTNAGVVRVVYAEAYGAPYPYTPNVKLEQL